MDDVIVMSEATLTGVNAVEADVAVMVTDPEGTTGGAV